MFVIVLNSSTVRQQCNQRRKGGFTLQSYTSTAAHEMNTSARPMLRSDPSHVRRQLRKHSINRYIHVTFQCGQQRDTSCQNWARRILRLVSHLIAYNSQHEKRRWPPSTEKQWPQCSLHLHQFTWCCWTAAETSVFCNRQLIQLGRHLLLSFPQSADWTVLTIRK